MLVIIFTYNREEMLRSLVAELQSPIETEGPEKSIILTPRTDLDVVVIDDGSEWSKELYPNNIHIEGFIRTNHEGKKGFWKKWLIARQIALGSGHDYFLFLPDDIKDLNLQTIEALTKQGWDDHLFAVNIINCNRLECWGRYRSGQEDIEIEDTILKEVGFVDCGFLTNRQTLELVPIHEVPEAWFERENISSGVGSQMSLAMRDLDVKMMMPFPGLCHYDGKHESVMHPKPVNHKSQRKKKVINTRRR